MTTDTTRDDGLVEFTVVPGWPAKGRHHIVEPAEHSAVRDFRRDVMDHRIRIAHDDGLYRHIVFSRSGTGVSYHWFEVITWPGNLTINGDMGTYTFRREPDMLPFFEKQRTNPDYWAQKVTAADRTDKVRDFDVRTLIESLAIDREAWVTEILDAFDVAHPDPDTTPDPQLVDPDRLAAALDAIEGLDRELDALVDLAHDRDSTDGAYDILWNFTHDVDNDEYDVHLELTVYEVSETTIEDFTYRFAWCCTALPWAVAAYRDERARLDARSGWARLRDWWATRKGRTPDAVRVLRDVPLRAGGPL